MTVLVSGRKKPKVGVCRCCGATHAAFSTHFWCRGDFHPRENSDVCDSCWDKYITHHQRSYEEISDENFQLWLVQIRIPTMLARLSSGKSIDICEVVDSKGFQCNAFSNMTRDGRKVCQKHGKNSHDLTYNPVDGKLSPLMHMLRFAIDRDPDLKEKMKELVK